MIRVNEAYDRSKYKIDFLESSYEELKKVINNQTGNPNDEAYFGSIETKDGQYCVEVHARYYGDMLEPDYDILDLVSTEYADYVTGGTMDLSLSYDEQVDFLISQLEGTFQLKYENKKTISEDWGANSTTVKDWFEAESYKDKCDFISIVDPVDNTLWEGEPWVFDEMHIYGDSKVIDEFYDGNGLCILTIKD